MSGGTTDTYGLNSTGTMDTPVTPAKRLVSQIGEDVDPLSPTTRTPIRPLTAAYKAASNPHEASIVFPTVETWYKEIRGAGAFHEIVSHWQLL